MIKILADGFDYASINSTLNIVLIVMFVVLIVTLVLEILRGLTKGVFKTTFQFIMILTMVVIAFSTLNVLTDTIGGVDLKPILGQYMILTSSDGTKSFTVEVSTVMKTLSDGIEATMVMYGFAGTASEISAIAVTIARSIVLVVLLIVDIILILILGNLFISLLWHLFFKRLVPKLQRKSVKIRWLSGLEQGVKYLAVTLLFMMPFTSIVNTLNNSYQKLDEKAKQNEMVQNIGSFLDTYNDSIFAQSLFHWSYDEKTGMTWDTSFLSYLTKAGIDYGDGNIETISASELLCTLSDISFVALGVAGGATNAATIINGITGDTLVTVFDALNKYQFFSYVLPIGVSIGMGFLNGEPLDEDAFAGVNFQNDTIAVQSFIVDLFNAGILDNLFKDNGDGTTIFDPTIIIDNILSPKAHDYVNRAIKRIDDCEILKRAIPAVMSYFAKSSGDGPLASLLPTAEEAASISWGNELSVLYDNLYQIKMGDPELFELVKSQMANNNTSGPEVKAAPSEEENKDDLGTKIFENLLAHADLFKHVLLGDFDSEGNLINVDSHGYAKRSPFSSRHVPLFDLTLINRIIGPTFNTIKTKLSENEAFGDVSSMMDIVTNTLFDEKYLINVKQEIGVIFDILHSFTENGVIDLFKELAEEGKKENPDFQGVMDRINSKDPYKINDISNNLTLIDHSKILPVIFRELLKTTLVPEDNKESGLSVLNDLGIEINKSDIDAIENIGYEASKLIKAMPHILKLRDIMPQGNEDMNFDNIEKNYENIAAVLDTVYNSEILNPKGVDNFDNNFVSLLENILDKMAEKVPGIAFKREVIQSLMNKEHQNWENSVDANGDYPRDRYGNVILDGEIGDIVNVLRCFALKVDGKSIIESFSDTTSIVETIGKLNKDRQIETLFASIERSAVFKATFGDFLDATLGGDDIGLIGDGRSFNEVANWADEGKKFGDMCNALGSSKTVIKDFNNISFTNFDDYEALNKLCHALANSSIFTEIDCDNPSQYTTFNDFIYSKIKDSMSDLLKDDDIANTDPNPVPTFNKALKDFDISYIDENGDVVPILAKKSDWCNDDWIDRFMDMPSEEIKLHEKEFYEGDLISDVINVVKNVKDIDPNAGNEGGDIGDSMSSLDIEPEKLNTLLQSMNKVQPFRMVLYNSLARVFTNVNISLFDFESANYEWIASEDGADVNERSLEIDRIVNVYDVYFNHFKSLQDGNVDLTELLKTPENVIYLRDMLASISTSNIFHKAGLRQTAIPKEATFFQNLVEAMLENAKFDSFFYRASNPHSLDKQVKHENYFDYNSKVQHFVREKIFSLDAQHIKDEIIEKNVSQFLEILSSVTGGPKDVYNVELDPNGKLPLDTLKYDGILEEDSNGNLTIGLSVENFTSSKIEPIITNMNQSDMFKTAVPNIIDMILSESASMAGASPIIVDITKNADPYFCYWPKGYDVAFDPKDGANSYTDSFDDPKDNDISLLMSTIDSFKSLADFLKEHDLSLIMSPEFGEANFNHFKDIFGDTLEKLNASNIFYKYKANVRTYLGYKTSLSSFETIFEKVYHDTHLDELIYNEGNSFDFDNYKADKSDPEHVITREQNKVISQIVNLSHQEKVDGKICELWSNEIGYLLEFLQAARALEINDFNGATNIMTKQSFSPRNLNNVLVALNKMETTQGAIAHLLHQSLGETIFKAYSTFDGIDRTNYYLSQEQFGAKGGIDSFITFLDDLATYKMDSAGNYLDSAGQIIPKENVNLNTKVFLNYVLPEEGANDPIVGFIGTEEDPNKSTSCILKFIRNCTMFNNEFAIDATDPSSEKINTYSLVLYNLICPEASTFTIGNYILGESRIDKILTVNQLLNLPGYTPEADGNAIDTLIRSNFVDSNFVPGDIKQINKSLQDKLSRIFYSLTFEDGKVTIVDGKYEGKQRERAYVVSEILAGIIDELVQAEIDVNNIKLSSVDPLFIDSNTRILTREKADHTKATKYSEITTTTYDLLSPYEGTALSGILDLFGSFSDFTFSTTDPDLANKVDALNSSLSRNFAKLTYVKEVENVEKHYNSQIGSLIYQSRVSPILEKGLLAPTQEEADKIIKAANDHATDYIWLGQHPTVETFRSLYSNYKNDPELSYITANKSTYSLSKTSQLFDSELFFKLKNSNNCLYDYLTRTLTPSNLLFSFTAHDALVSLGGAK